MASAFRILRPVAVALFMAQAGFAQAQEITDSHLAAARAAIAAIHATDPYDGILLQAADSLKSELIQKNPNLLDLISQTVDETVLALAARRGDLETEAATLYAKSFSEADLTAITAFYTSDTGKKLLSDGPIATRELGKSADIWAKGVARDLAEKVAATLAEKTPKTPEGGAAPAEGGAAPAEGEQKPQQ
jgi:hypothetical protein